MTVKSKAGAKKLPITPKHDAAGSGARKPRGYGAMRDAPLNLDPRIDLTKPIYDQLAELEKTDAGRHP